MVLLKNKDKNMISSQIIDRFWKSLKTFFHMFWQWLQPQWIKTILFPFHEAIKLYKLINYLWVSQYWMLDMKCSESHRSLGKCVFNLVPKIDICLLVWLGLNTCHCKNVHFCQTNSKIFVLACLCESTRLNLREQI